VNEDQLPAAVSEGIARPTTTQRHIISGSLFRTRSRRVSFAEEPPPEQPQPPKPARRLGLTRARVSQLLGFCFLAPDIQEQILALEAVDGAEPMAERALRVVAHAGTWAEQRVAFNAQTATARDSST